MRIPSDFFPSYSNGSASSTTVILLSISAVILAVYCIVGFIKSKKTTPRQTRLPGPRRIPIFGNFLSIARTSLQLYHKDLTDKFGKTCMYYEGATPVILTKDLNLIRNVFIKDFSTSFVDRHSLVMFVNDPIDKFLLLIKGDDWKVMRKIMESTLSLDKIKQMSNKMLNCIRNYEDNLKDIIDKKKGIIQTQKFYSSYVMDVSSSCFYGLDINSIKEPNNKVLKNVENIFKQGLLQKLKLFLLFLAPNFTSNLVKSNKLDIAPMDAANYLIDLANKIIAERKVSPEAKRYDFMDNMIELGEDSTLVSIEDGEEVKEVKKTLSNSEIVAQAILFLAAGYINPHLALEFISYNLAKHPAVQETLIKEIDRVLEKHNQISYDSIQDMKYMDMVIMETLRMYPPTIKLDRTATKDYVYEGMTIKKGQQITVPIHAMHHDAGIYPNPEEFKPERFTEENKAARDSLTFLAFGAGARNCIGVKFALSVIKLFLTSILIKYKFRTCDKTPETIVLDKSGSTRSEKPIFVQLEKRTLLYTI